jgi:hypothetical protein
VAVSDDLIIKVAAEIDDAVAKLRALNSETKQVGDGAKGVGETFASMRDVMQGPIAMGRMVIDAVKGIWEETQKLYDEFAKAEESTIRFNAAMSQSDKLFVGAGDRIEAYIQQIKAKTYYDDDDLRTQAALLASYGRNEAEIQKIIGAAADWAAMSGESLPVAINKLNMTMNGNIGRLGASYGEIAKLTEAELAAGKAVEIMANKFEGGAERMSKSAAGVKKDLEASLGDVKEYIGGLIATLEAPALKAANEMLMAQQQTQAFGLIMTSIRKGETAELNKQKATTLGVLEAQLKIAEATAFDNVIAAKRLRLDADKLEKQGKYAEATEKVKQAATLEMQIQVELNRLGIKSVEEYGKLIVIRDNLVTAAKTESDLAKKQADDVAKALAAAAELERLRAKEVSDSIFIAGEAKNTADYWASYIDNYKTLHGYMEGVLANANEWADLEQILADTQAEINGNLEAAAAPDGPIAISADLSSLLSDTWLELRDNILSSRDAAASFTKEISGGMEAAQDLQETLSPTDNSKIFDDGQPGSGTRIAASNKGAAAIDRQREALVKMSGYIDEVYAKKEKIAEVEEYSLKIAETQLDTYGYMDRYQKEFIRGSSLTVKLAEDEKRAREEMAKWAESFNGQLKNIAMGAMQEVVTMLDKAGSVGWGEAVDGFDSYMVKLVDQLPMLLLTAGLQVMGLNWVVGVALVAASGLVALIDIATTSDAEKAAYSSATGGGGGKGGGGGMTVNQYIEGSVWSQREMEAMAVGANQRYARGY